MKVRLQVFESSDRDHLSGTSAKGAYDFWLQYGLLDQAPARPCSVVVAREPDRSRLLVPGVYEAELFLEDRKGQVVPVFSSFKLLPVSKVG